MEYQTYTDKTLEKIAKEELPKNYIPMTEEEFIRFLQPIKVTRPLKQQRFFMLTYELIYKKLKRLILKNTHKEKDNLLLELEKSYIINK